MYYVLTADWTKMSSEASIPLVGDRLDTVDFFIYLWSTNSIKAKSYNLSVSFSKSMPRIDYIDSAGSITISSAKFIYELTRLGALIESLPIKIIDRKTGETIDEEYYIMHPLIGVDAFDLSKSSRRSANRIKRLVFSKDFLKSTLPLVREREHRLILVHHDLRSKMENSSLKGYHFTSIEDY